MVRQVTRGMIGHVAVDVTLYAGNLRRLKAGGWSLDISDRSTVAGVGVSVLERAERTQSGA